MAENTEAFTRKQAREPHTKAFSMDKNELRGRSLVDTYKSYNEFNSAEELSKVCAVYSQAYTETMLMRLEEEDPDFFANKNISRTEFAVNLAQQICLPYEKYYSKVFRQTTAAIKEKEHINDTMRRLTNGGDKFHPYI